MSIYNSILPYLKTGDPNDPLKILIHPRLAMSQISLALQK